jgi:hypothetical protein
MKNTEQDFDFRSSAFNQSDGKAFCSAKTQA